MTDKISDAELVIILAHEQGCSNYAGDGDVLCGLELDDPPQRCDCLRVVRVLREAIEQNRMTTSFCSEIVRLQVGIQRYGLHTWECAYNDSKGELACNCGWEELRQTFHETEPAKTEG